MAADGFKLNCSKAEKIWFSSRRSSRQIFTSHLHWRYSSDFKRGCRGGGSYVGEALATWLSLQHLSRIFAPNTFPEKSVTYSSESYLRLCSSDVKYYCILPSCILYQIQFYCIYYYCIVSTIIVFYQLLLYCINYYCNATTIIVLSCFYIVSDAISLYFTRSYLTVPTKVNR